MLCWTSGCDPPAIERPGRARAFLARASDDCQHTTCLALSIDDPGNCAALSRVCAGTVPDPSNPRWLTLGSGTLHTPFLYLAVTAKNEVAQLDTATGQKNWQQKYGSSSSGFRSGSPYLDFPCRYSILL